MQKEIFKDCLHHIIEYNKALDLWCQLLSPDIFTSPVFVHAGFIADKLVDFLGQGDEEVIDLINWWLYEDVEKVLFNKGKEIEVNTLDKLYDFIKETYYDNKGN